MYKAIADIWFLPTNPEEFICAGEPDKTITVTGGTSAYTKQEVWNQMSFFLRSQTRDAYIELTLEKDGVYKDSDSAYYEGGVFHDP